MSWIRNEATVRVAKLFEEILGPHARCPFNLSGGEQKLRNYMIDYVVSIVKKKIRRLSVGESMSDLDAINEAWAMSEPQFRDSIKKPPQNGCVIDPTDFTPMRNDVLSTPFVNLDILDDQLKEMISYAAMKTREIVGKHDWLNGAHSMTLNSRIGHFVTNLRRDLTVFISKLPDDIKDTASHNMTLRRFLAKFFEPGMWLDVAEPRIYGSYGSDGWRFSCVYNNRLWRMDGARMAELCNRAVTLSPDQQTSRDIEDSLAALQREMYPLRSSVEKMDQINRESDQIIGNLCAIAEGR